jgi:hypothetical protein
MIISSWHPVHFEGHRPMLFDLTTHPQEFNDLGADPAKPSNQDLAATASAPPRNQTPMCKFKAVDLIYSNWLCSGQIYYRVL